jgi:predicted nuclease with TOPRIM domain
MIIYAKIKEVDEDIRKLDTEQKRLGEKLKIHEQLIDLKARIEVLEKGGKYGKN